MDSENRRVPQEVRESQPRSPEVNVYVYRHAEALGQGKEVDITDKGIIQSKRAAEVLYEQIKQKGGLVKFVTSPIKRCIQTGQAMEGRINELINESGNQKVKLMRSKTKPSLGLPGVAPVLQRMGIDREDIVEYWLTHPDVVPGKTPRDISTRIVDMVRIIQKVANRLNEGTNIDYVYVTHEPYHAAFLNQLTGKTLSGLGGDIENCEAMKIQVFGNSDQPAKLEFRDLRLDL